MESFRWNKNFVTGIREVDDQHHYLVNLINQFGDLLTRNKVEHNDIENIFKELADYSQYHFREEEALMVRVGIDQRYFRQHIEIHHNFLNELKSMHAGLSEEDSDSANNLLSFLVNWLAYHILCNDQNMARQIFSIQSGVSPSQAYENEEKETLSSTEPLLAALDNLFQQVSEKNKVLIKLNHSLEKKVIERTKELSKANSHLEEIALTDVLTGLPNRRKAMRCLALLWEESIQKNTSLVCMMIDADNFKEVNDTYGHNAGDIVLIELAKTLLHTFRNDDIVCRLGGDEFFAICPDTDIEGGMLIAELVRKKVSELRVITGGEPWHGSISIGVASRTSNLNSHEKLIQLSDKGVYIAKQDGKNCVRTETSM